MENENNQEVIKFNEKCYFGFDLSSSLLAHFY